MTSIQIHLNRNHMDRNQVLVLRIAAFIAIVIGSIILFAVAAGAQVRQPVQGEGVTLTEVSRLADVEQGSTCQVEALNNVSVYPENMLVIEGGRLPGLALAIGTSGVISVPVEQFDGEDLIVDFVATGGDVVVSVAWVVHTSVDDIPITCTPPTCPIADAIDAGWTPGGDIPCGHGPDIAPTTTTTVPTTPTTGTVPPTVTTPPEDCPEDGLACTGPSGVSTGSLAIGALTALLIGGSFILAAWRFR